MASLTLKNLPDDLLRDLRAAAEADRRSLTREIVHLLEGGLRGRPAEPALPPRHVKAQLAAWRKLAGRWESDLPFSTEAARLMKRRTSGRSVRL
jgi:plasmid stability protein